MNHTQLTREGFEKLQAELNDLKEVKRPLAVERLKKARAMGDLSESSEYASAKEDLAFVEGRILEIETMLKGAVVVETTQSKDFAALGSTITVKFDGQEDTYKLVGEFEADPLEKKLSITSPLGKALLGKKKGDVVEVEAPSGKMTYQITSIQ